MIHSVEPIKPTVCPYCGHTVPIANGVAAIPNLDDLVVCTCCQQITVATGDGGEVRKPTDDERRRDAARYAAIKRLSS